MTTMLVMDDSGELRNILKLTFGYSRFRFHEAENGREGLALAKRIKPDVVVLDIMMPEMDGYEVCRQLRQMEETADCLIVMLSMLAHPSERERGYAEGADLYMTKPFSPAELIHAIEDLLSKRGLAD